MGNLPEINTRVKIPITLPTPGYLRDHHFQGKPVLPAVEAMSALVRTAKETYPRLKVDHLANARFDKFLFLEQDSGQVDAVAAFSQLENGHLQATLLTRTKSPKAAFTRTKTHVCIDIVPGEAPKTEFPLDMAAAVEGICTIVPPEKIYADLVPFGPTFRNICAPLHITPNGALARIQTPHEQYHTTDDTLLLGSGYALDAAFHAACVWSQHYKGIVAFPMAVERRTIITPTRPGKSYLGRVIPKSISDTLMTFDIFLLDTAGNICEVAEGVHMRDVSGGRLQPPGWIRRETIPASLTGLKRAGQKMAVVELDAVAEFAHMALSPLEKERYDKMGDRRRKSFLAARLALKRLYRQYRDGDCTTPAEQIDTVRENSPLPWIAPVNASRRVNCSVSHDQRFAIAVTDSHPIGVDVEPISSKALSADRIFMHPDEQKMVKQASMDAMDAAVRIWSVKEAVAKATGISLADTWTRVQVSRVGETQSAIKLDEQSMTARHATVDGHLFTLFRLNPNTA